jgi:hypothetical protein
VSRGISKYSATVVCGTWASFATLVKFTLAALQWAATCARPRAQGREERLAGLARAEQKAGFPADPAFQTGETCNHWGRHGSPGMPAVSSYITRNDDTVVNIPHALPAQLRAGALFLAVPARLSL